MLRWKGCKLRIAILCEKMSQGRDWATALGLQGMSGRVGGDDVTVLPAHGYVYSDTAANDAGYPAPDLMVPERLRDDYRSWDPDKLPWDLHDMDFSIRPARYRAMDRSTGRWGVHDETGWCRDDVRTLAGFDELVLAGDSDPVEQGDTGFHIEAQRVLAGGFEHTKRITVAEFANQAPAVMRKAFDQREVVPDVAADPRYTGRETQARIDWATMQFSRLARVLSGSKATPRQGRLKSPIVKLVGDQWVAVKGFRSVPGYVNRYKDECGVVYESKKEKVWPDKGSVPGGLAESAVVEDSTGERHIGPPQLPDLAALAAALAPRGIHPGDVTATYQRMYEAHVVTYPRTSDRKMVGREQYEALMGLVDRIARCIGVDPSTLTHREVRPSHVMAKGAHGPNRPDANVPGSLDEVRASFGETGAAIYEVLARAALALAAPDAVTRVTKGHVADHPDFIGRVSVPVSPGWRAVYDPDVSDGVNEDGDGGDTPARLGSRAVPFVAETRPRPPQKPTVKWLVARLTDHEVGTGATRTSTIGEVSTGSGALLKEERGRLTLTELGEVSYTLLPGTVIGDVAATERTYAIMADVMAGRAGYEAVDEVADWVRRDRETMGANAARAGMHRSAPGGDGSRVKVGGAWMDSGFQGHRFTDGELAALEAGSEVSFDVVSHLGGGVRKVTGRLKRLTSRNGGERVAFVASTAPLYATAPDYRP